MAIDPMPDFVSFIYRLEMVCLFITTTWFVYPTSERPKTTDSVNISHCLFQSMRLGIDFHHRGKKGAERRRAVGGTRVCVFLEDEHSTWKGSCFSQIHKAMDSRVRFYCVCVRRSARLWDHRRDLGENIDT